MGIAGLGGLGQMGVLLAKAMGNHVTVISSSSRKIAMAKGQEISEGNLVSIKNPYLFFDSTT